MHVDVYTCMLACNIFKLPVSYPDPPTKKNLERVWTNMSKRNAIIVSAVHYLDTWSVCTMISFLVSIVHVCYSKVITGISKYALPLLLF